MTTDDDLRKAQRQIERYGTEFAARGRRAEFIAVLEAESQRQRAAQDLPQIPVGGDDYAEREQTPNEANRYRLAQAAKLIRLGLVERDESGEIVPTAEFAEHDAIEPDPEDFAQVEAEARRSFRQGDVGELGGEA